MLYVLSKNKPQNQSAANSEEIYAASEEQQALTETIAGFASSTSKMAEILEREINQFTVSEEDQKSTNNQIESKVFTLNENEEEKNINELIEDNADAQIENEEA